MVLGWSATWVNVWDVALTSATSCAAANAGSAAVAAATDPTTAPTLLTPASKLATRVPSSPADALIATRAPARARAAASTQRGRAV